jgi:hypothetical protein
MRFTANKILLARSLPSHEEGVSRRLAEDLRVESFAKNSLPVEDQSIQSKSDLLILFSSIARKFREDGEIPFLHNDAHGEKGFLQFSSGEHMPWTEFISHTTRLNKNLEMNLAVSLGVCEGAWSIIGMKGIERAPFMLLFAPKNPLSAADATMWSKKLYSGILDNQPIGHVYESANLLVALESNFSIYTAANLFHLVINSYIEDHSDRASKRYRAAKLLRASRKISKNNNNNSYQTSDVVKKLTMTEFEIEKMWKRYARHDLAQNVAARTPFPTDWKWKLSPRIKNGKSRKRLLKEKRKSEPSYGMLTSYYKSLPIEDDMNP